MTFASLAPETRVLNRARELSATTVFLATLAGIPQSRINQAFKGIREFSREDAELLLGLTQELMELQEAMQPFPLAFVNPTKIRALLDMMAERGITSDKIRTIVAGVFEQTTDCSE
jgi:hypothetical protein